MALASKPELRCWSVRLAKNKKATKTNYSIANNKFILHKFHKKHKTGSNTKIPPKFKKNWSFLFINFYHAPKQLPFLYPTKMYCILLLQKMLALLTPPAKGSKVNSSILPLAQNQGHFKGVSFQEMPSEMLSWIFQSKFIVAKCFSNANHLWTFWVIFHN